VIRLSRLSVLLAAAGLLAGCITTRVPVAGEFPAPVMRPLPYAVGVHYPQALEEYRHEEKIASGRTWIVSLGDIHVAMFDRLLGGIFARLVRVDELPTGKPRDQRLDGIIEPLIEDFQFSTPSQTQSKFYEVWIRYRLSLYAPTGKLVTSWPLSAYGKSRSQFAQASDSINDATIVAMRDAAASLAVKFKTEPEVAEWFTSRQETGTTVDYTEAQDEIDAGKGTRLQQAGGDGRPGAY
jgi:hypothetical protein